jgi:drug/metabolite transporter (DMT)-like permease
VNASIRAPVGLIAISGVLWGTSFVAMKVGLGFVDPYSFAFLRLVTASVFSAALLFVRERPQLNVLRNWKIWVLGILNAGGFILEYVGISYTTANRTALIVNSNVAFTAFLSWSLYHEPMGFGNLLALPLSVLGLFLLVTGGDLSALSGGQVMGDLLVLLAGLVWSFFLVLNKDMVSRGSTNISQMVAWVMLVSTIGIAPVAFLLGVVTTVAVPWEGWVAVAYTAIPCTVIPYWLFTRAQRFVSTTLSALVLLIEVVVAIISSALILGEQFAIGSGLGAVLVCASIALASRSSSSG